MGKMATYAAANQPKAEKSKLKTKAGGKTDASNAALLFQRSFQQLAPENKQLAVEFVKLLNRRQIKK